ncbi:hypothetical protein BS78_03G086900, partial [Paspalum vaginatum]
MRAITGAIVSSKSCSLAKAACILERFSDSAASHLPSSDCATYLSVAADAASQHNLFRRGLRAGHQQGAANRDAHDHVGPVEGDRRHQDRKSGGDMTFHADGDSAVEAKVEVSSEKKSKKKKEDLQVERVVAGADSHIPRSPEISSEKRMKKKKHPNQETIVAVKQEPVLVAEEDLGSEKKNKKKQVNGHVKLEEGAHEVAEKPVDDGATEQNVASGKKKKRKKNGEEEGDAKDAKE